MADEERRQTSRVPFVAEVLCRIDEFSFSRRSINISSDGMFIEDAHPPENDSAISVEFTLNGTSISFSGRVVFRKPPVGFGVSIEDIEPEVRKRIENHVQVLLSRLRQG